MKTFTFIKDDFNSIFLNNSLISHVKSGNHYLGSVSNSRFTLKLTSMTSTLVRNNMELAVLINFLRCGLLKQ